jgi:hypothetical protein
MSATKIVSSAAIKTIQKSGKDIALKYATMTEACPPWRRPMSRPTPRLPS